MTNIDVKRGIAKLDELAIKPYSRIRHGEVNFCELREVLEAMLPEKDVAEEKCPNCGLVHPIEYLHACPSKPSESVLIPRSVAENYLHRHTGADLNGEAYALFNAIKTAFEAK